MNQVEFFTFYPLTWERALYVLGAHYEQDVSASAYRAWLGSFEARARALCLSRLSWYEDRVYDKVRRDLGVSVYVEPGELWHEWPSITDEYFCEAGLHRIRDWLESLSETIDAYRERIPHTSWTPPDGLDYVIAMLKEEHPDQKRIFAMQDATKELWQEWFRTSTQPDDLTTAELKRMPYQSYLQSDYWRRVRYALLIANRLRCQSSECYGLDSWFGAEHNLHVHHLHYRNRGQEELSNLVLLCADCHNKHHEGALEIQAVDSEDALLW